MNTVFCQKCDKPLPPELVKQKKPCPECGCKLRNYKLNAEMGPYKLRGIDVKLRTTIKVIKEYPIISALYFALMVLTIVIGYVIPGVIGFLLILPITYFVHYLGDERKEEHIRKETH